MNNLYDLSDKTQVQNLLTEIKGKSILKIELLIDQETDEEYIRLTLDDNSELEINLDLDVHYCVYFK